MSAPLPALNVDEALHAAVMRAQIESLQGAVHCATAEADPATIRARLTGLLHDRQTALLDLYQRAAARQPGTPA